MAGADEIAKRCDFKKATVLVEFQGPVVERGDGGPDVFRTLASLRLDPFANRLAGPPPAVGAEEGEEFDIGPQEPGMAHAKNPRRQVPARRDREAEKGGIASRKITGKPLGPVSEGAPRVHSGEFAAYPLDVRLFESGEGKTPQRIAPFGKRRAFRRRPPTPRLNQRFPRSR